jgi:hypothetical protein
MGLFDLFKKKSAQKSPEPATPVRQLEPQAKAPYFGDLEKTRVIYQLVKTPHNDRDAAWQQAFLSAVAQASFKCGNPQLISGPDGFPYFQLFLPEPNKEFKCYVIDHMKNDFLLDSGYGVVINPTAEQPDWVFTYGDIVNLRLNQMFYTSEKTAFTKNAQHDEVLKESEEVLIGQPSESLLPIATRQVLKSFLQTQGVSTPKILLMQRKNKSTFEITQDLVFNLTPENFDNEEHYRTVMQHLGWFLPRQYAYAGMSEKTLTDFMPL